MQKILACDIGFGYTKYMLAEIDNNSAHITQKEKFPSAIRFLINSDDFNIKEHPDFVELNEKSYLVGYSALISDKGLRIRSSEFMLENIEVFMNKVFKNLNFTETDKPDLLIVGTPFNEWKRLKDKIIQKLKKFSKGDVICIPQAAAASLMIKPTWNYALVVDIGFNTCDVVPLDREGRVLSDEGISWEKYGVSAIIDDVSSLVKNVCGISLNAAELEEIVNKPKKIKKYFNSVSDDFIQAFQSKLDSIVNDKFYLTSAKITDRFGSSFDKLILVGGGALIHKKYFKKLYGKKVIIPKNSDFANTIGFILYGLSYMNFSGNIEWEHKKQQNDTGKDKQESEKVDNKLENSETDDELPS